MSHYFIAGNMWLLAAAVVFWGREFIGSIDVTPGYEPWRLFGVGRTFYAYQYPWILGALILIAVVCFFLHVRWSRSQA